MAGHQGTSLPLTVSKSLNMQKEDVTPTNQPLIGFEGGTIHPVGTVKLVVRLGEKDKVEAYQSIY